MIFNPGFLLDKKIGVNQPKRMEDAKILIANTAMDTDKIKVVLLKTIFMEVAIFHYSICKLYYVVAHYQM